MASSLSDLANHLAEGIHKIKFKYKHDGEKQLQLATILQLLS